MGTPINIEVDVDNPKDLRMLLWVIAFKRAQANSNGYSASNAIEYANEAVSGFDAKFGASEKPEGGG